MFHKESKFHHFCKKIFHKESKFHHFCKKIFHKESVWYKFYKIPIVNFTLEVLGNAISIIVMVAVIRTFLFSPFHVSGESMQHTLLDHDYIIVDKLSYRVSQPKFGNIIVFTPPSPRMSKVDGIRCIVAKVAKFDFADDACILPDFFIKRIIGLPGDTIKIENSLVYRNGELLEEKYLDEFNKNNTQVAEGSKIYLVPENKYFVLGDNRIGSSDSRMHSKEWRDPDTNKTQPFITKKSIHGRYLFTFISFQKVQNFILELL